MTNLRIAASLLLLKILSATVLPSQATDKANAVRLPELVSLDYCADQYVLALADRQQIKAVSKGALEAYSFYRDRAVGLPVIDSTIPEVIALKPAIAVQSYSVAARMPEMTERTGIQLIKTKFGSSPEIVLENVRMVGSALGRRDAAEALIADFQQRLGKLQVAAKSSLKIAYVTPSGFTSGTNTFVDGVIEVAGFRSYAEAKGYRGWLLLPLEDIVMDPPDMFVTSFFDTNMQNQSNWSLSRHDRLIAMMEETPTVDLPGSYLACNGLFLLDAAEAIRGKALELGLLQEEKD